MSLQRAGAEWRNPPSSKMQQRALSVVRNTVAMQAPPNFVNL